MKPNLLLFIALIVISTLLFINLPDDAPGVAARPENDGGTSSREVSAELQRMRGDYSLLMQEMALLRTRLEQAQPVAAENRRAGLADEKTADDGGAPGVTIYLDTSKLPSAGGQGHEWTAVGFHDAGRAADGSKQAVLSITKVTPPQGAQEEQPRAVPVSRWQ